MTPETTAVNLPHVPSTVRDIPVPLTPEQIGARAKEADHRNCIGYSSRSLPARKVDFDTLASLLRHIGNASSRTCVDPKLRIKNSDLVVKLGPSNYRPLIKNFRLKSDRLGNIHALHALNITKLPLRASASERFLCALSTVGNVLIGRGAGHARSEHLSLDLHTLRKKVADRVDCLRLDGCTDGTSACLDTQFFNGKHAKELEDIRLTGMDLNRCDLAHTSLKGKNLARCNLPMDMTGVDLREATLYDVSFGHTRRLPERMHISRTYFESWGDRIEKVLSHGRSLGKFYPDFSGVQMQGAKLTLPSPFKAGDDDKTAVLDLGYNHLNNSSSGSILKSIHSIGDLTLKKKLMETCMADLLAHTSRQERASISRPLIDILFNRDYLSADSKNSSVRKVVDEIIEENFAHGDKDLLDLSKFFSIDLRMFLDEHLSHAHHVIDKLTPKDPASAFCQQLLQACTNSEEDQELHERAISLQRKIFELPFHAGAIQGMCDILGYDNGNEVELGGLVTFDADDQESIVMTGQYYRNFVQNIAIENDLLENPDEGIELFTAGGENVRSKPIGYISKNEFLNKFLKPAFATTNITSMLGFKLRPAYEKLFNDGRLSSVFGNKDMVTPEDKIYLASVVEPFLEDQQTSTRRLVTVKKTYTERLIANHSMDKGSTSEQGYLLLCMSALFTKYSSSSHFGTEYDSPDALRALAAGLLTSARELLPNAARGEEITQLQDILLGNGGAFTCTSVAYIRMKRLLLEICTAHPALRPIYEKILPPTWR